MARTGNEVLQIRACIGVLKGGGTYLGRRHQICSFNHFAAITRASSASGIDGSEC